jgi:phosphotransferase system enzyme I (PtsI)
VRRELEELYGEMTGGDAPAEFAALLDVHTMILNDPTLSEAPKRLIAEQHCNAEWALTQQMSVLVDQFEQIEDEYLRERKADVVQIVERILKRLLGKPGAVRPGGAEQHTILVAHGLSPADVTVQDAPLRRLSPARCVTSHSDRRAASRCRVVATHARQLIRENELLILDGTPRGYHQRTVVLSSTG